MCAEENLFVDIVLVYQTSVNCFTSEAPAGQAATDMTDIVIEIRRGANSEQFLPLAIGCRGFY